MGRGGGGELGSAYFVAHPTIDLDNVVEYINLDMVGSYSSRGFVAAMGTFAKLPARAMLEAGMKAYPKLSVGLGGRAERSDHEAFCEQGIPYVFFWTPDTRCYHETCDTADKLDTAHMAQIAALAGDLVARLADTQARSRARRDEASAASASASASQASVRRIFHRPIANQTSREHRHRDRGRQSIGHVADAVLGNPGDQARLVRDRQVCSDAGISPTGTSNNSM